MVVQKRNYYFCRLGKKSANIGKIRAYCSVINCPHLGAKKRKNLIQIEVTHVR